MFIRFCFLQCYLSTILVAQSPHLFVSKPYAETIDQKIEIKVDGLAPFQKIELKAEAEDQKGEIWSSHASFQAEQEVMDHKICINPTRLLLRTADQSNSR